MLIQTLEKMYVMLEKMARYDRENCHESSEYLAATGIDYYDEILTIQANINFFLRSDK
jgi:hypothetical protein